MEPHGTRISRNCIDDEGPMDSIPSDTDATHAPDGGQCETAAGGTAWCEQPCFACHANYREEPLAATHAARSVGCMDCHGKSNEHRNDENNTTPPEAMYARDAIERA